ncbi:hypothetical protein AB0Q95_00100 [Streptomyces sp. NPDC059900]|uniref:hypothetical protein n=1 Tax=Streptomyces sp. NPDC059900 TaxID=3155816 RepID=UPI003417FEF0
MSSRLYSGMTEDEAKFAAYSEELIGSPMHHGEGMERDDSRYTCSTGGCGATVDVDPSATPPGTKRF